MKVRCCTVSWIAERNHHSITQHQFVASEKQLAVSDRNISAAGMANLCRALCREIEIYKQILSVADNFSKEQVKESLRELHRTCPRQVDCV